MNYKIIKVLNNNSVLAQSFSGNQVVLMSKGIGYGKSKGDKIKDGEKYQKVFYILDSGQNINKLEKFGTEHEKMEAVTYKIVNVAEATLNFKNENFYKALIDHLTFAVERLQMSLPIKNPYIMEVSVLCQQEYAVAQIAAEIIKEQLNVEVGIEETSFIAMHIYAARKNKHIDTVMKNMRIINEVSQKAFKYAGKNAATLNYATADFILSISQLIKDAIAKKTIHTKLKGQICCCIPREWCFAQKIAEYVNNELDITLDEDYISLLALDVYKLIQL
ncbi:MAG TPA: hypothetical protein DG942_03070 [Ruminococcaceae bacterium]|jgi:transcriptional antiterminator|nr:hypothetical protein [Oscillospiraceae bacterium]